MPLQARGQATVESILDATAQLIEEVGLDAITTNLIASAAGVNIATLYQYFSNKHAVLLALYDRQMDERASERAGLFEAIQRGDDWRVPVIQSIEAAARLRATQRGATAIRLAVRLTPDLQAHDRADSERSARVVADMLMRLTDVEEERALLIGRVSVEMAGAILDVWSFEHDPTDLRVVEEAKTAAIAYLSKYFEPGRT